MKKFLPVLLVALILTLSRSNITPLANASEDNNKANIEAENENSIISNIINGFGKNMFQLRIKDDNSHKSDDNNNKKFMIKGVITANSSNSVTINSQLINIDSSVTEDIKIVGNVTPGMFAMAKGIIIDSNFYANKIVVDNRNKKEVEEENEDENDDISLTPTLTASPSPTLSPTPTTTESADLEESAGIQTNINLQFSSLVQALENFLNNLKNIISTI